MLLYEALNKVASYSAPLSNLLRTQLYFLCVKERHILDYCKHVVDFSLDYTTLPDPKPPETLNPSTISQAPFLDP